MKLATKEKKENRINNPPDRAPPCLIESVNKPAFRENSIFKIRKKPTLRIRVDGQNQKGTPLQKMTFPIYNPGTVIKRAPAAAEGQTLLQTLFLLAETDRGAKRFKNGILVIHHPPVRNNL
jgi:hypothetical protein